MADSTTDFLGEEKTPFNLRLLLLKYLRYWFLFVLSTTLTVGAMYWYLRFVTPIYQVSTTLLIKNQSKSPSDDILKEAEGIQSNKVVENEIELLKSRNLMLRVVDDLNLTVSYFNPGENRNDEELYGKSPVRVYADLLTPLSYQEPVQIKIVNNKQFELMDATGLRVGRYVFTQPTKSKYGTFRVFLNDSLYQKNNSLIKVAFYDRQEVAQRYKSAIKVDLLNLKSTLLKLSIDDALPEKGKAILSKLVEAYTYSALTDKNREAINTINFIDERLRLITDELNTVERNVESYKSNQGITDLSQEGNFYLSAVKENDAKANKINIQLQVLAGVEAYLKSNQRGIAPSTLSISDPILIGLLNQLNTLQIQQEKYLATVEPNNPFLQTVNLQIENVKGSIRESINNQRQDLLVTQNNLKQVGNRFESSIRTIPRKEREFVNIKRQQGIKESLYLLLLQKKEETAMAYASTVSDSRVVDDPYSPPYPIKPNKRNLYLIALLAGLLLPIGWISIRDVLNDKVQAREEIESETGLAVFGEIMHRHKKEHTVDFSNNTLIAEQFRTLRANLNYAVSSLALSEQQVILITSSISGEGKSFISVNLASSLALTNKRVVIVELDLRKPSIGSQLGIHTNQDLGLSGYLVDQVPFVDLLKQTDDNPNLYIIPSGVIPPNPSELLANGRIRTLLNDLRKQFDYIIIDTPPIALVADALLLAPYVDVAFYIVRYGYTPKSYLQWMNKMRKTHKFGSLNVIFNDIKNSNTQEYKNSYNYAYKRE